MSGREIAILHTEESENINNAAIKRFLAMAGTGTLIALLAIAAALVWRDASRMNNPNEVPSQVIVIAVTILWGAALIFLWGMKMSPLLSYRRYLREIRSGLSRTVEGVVTRFDTDTTYRDGISFYACVINVGGKGDPEDDRLLYWDTRLPRPEIASGDRVAVRAHGNDIIGFER